MEDCGFDNIDRISCNYMDFKSWIKEELKIEREYDSNKNNKIKEVFPNGDITLYYYDDRDNTIKEVDSDGATEKSKSKKSAIIIEIEINRIERRTLEDLENKTFKSIAELKQIIKQPCIVYDISEFTELLNGNYLDTEDHWYTTVFIQQS